MPAPDWALSTWMLVGTSSEVLAVHTCLLPTGRVLIFSGDETDRQFHDLGQYDHSRLFVPESNSVLPCTSPTTDVFCCGHAMLADGRLLVAGGIQEGEVKDFFMVGGTGLHAHHAPGSRATWVFDPNSESWTRLADLNLGPLAIGIEPGKAILRGGRWYPTLVTLSTGEVLAMSGHPGEADARHNNHTPEVLPGTATQADAWYVMPPVGDPDLDPAHTYPRLHVLPSGLVLAVTPLGANDMTSLYDAMTGDISELCMLPTDSGDLPNSSREEHLYLGYHCSSVLLPLRPADGYRPRVLLCNGEQPHVLDLGAAQPTWQPTGPRSLAGAPSRWNATSVLLPTGEVLVVGGIRLTPGTTGPDLLDINAVLAPEVFHPESNEWSTLPEGTVPRNYHSVGLLLPDGRVFVAGSNRNTWLGADQVEKRIEILSPWYCSSSVQRPQIADCPAVIRPGQAFRVAIASSDPISKVAIVRVGSVTHCYNSDQRYVELLFSAADANTLTVTGPPDTRLAPPGYYLLVLLDGNGVPSPGRFVRIPAEAHWTRWARLSEAAKTDRGVVASAVSSVPGGVSLFVVDREGAVQTAYFDPRLPGALWSPWARLSDAGKTRPGAAVSAVSSLPGGVSLFVVDREGAVQTAYFDPRPPGAQWSPWARLSEAGKTNPGAAVSAVSSVPGGVSLFVVDREGAVQTAYFDPRLPGAQWSPWARLSEAGKSNPGAAVSAVSSVPGGVSLFVVDREGAVQTAYFDPRLPGAQWSPWARLSEAGKTNPGTLVSSVSSVPGGVSLFVVDREGAVQTAYFDPRLPGAQWSPWARLSEAGKTNPGTLVSSVSSVPGGVSLFVVDREGAVQSAYFDPRLPGAQWSPWARLSEAGKTNPGTLVSSVSSVPGGVSLFVVDREGEVQTSYFDPRQSGA